MKLLRSVFNIKYLHQYRFLVILGSVAIFIATLTITQDYLDAYRNGGSFYFSESLLFKTVWLLFIPGLILLNKSLQNRSLENVQRTLLFIITPVLIHLLLLPFVFLFFSIVFYEGRYGLYKIFTYTLANDFHKLLLIYGTFVFVYKYFWAEKASQSSQNAPFLDIIVINNGQENTIVHVEDIQIIRSETPYVALHLENRKYLHTDSLKSISKQLDDSIFLRVHKSTVVNINSVVSYKSRLNGDYDLRLKKGDLVRLSRTYALDFKKRFNTPSSG
ncbi:LytTR family DNA-binding domain-containing protein [uncultured Marivirga sp.]|uniref:LytR/AlgR family response regulator transcription factor n=1 Tax=uncultured Marivirga sp. TaxID=1123707 RepID=UPI0030EC6F28